MRAFEQTDKDDYNYIDRPFESPREKRNEENMGEKYRLDSNQDY